MLEKLRLALAVPLALAVLALATAPAAAQEIAFEPGGEITATGSELVFEEERENLLTCEFAMGGVLNEGPITTGLELEIGSIETFETRCVGGELRPLLPWRIIDGELVSDEERGIIGLLFIVDAAYLISSNVPGEPNRLQCLYRGRMGVLALMRPEGDLHEYTFLPGSMPLHRSELNRARRRRCLPRLRHRGRLRFNPAQRLSII